MEHKKLFRPFRRRLLWQTLGHGALLGLAVGGVAVFLLTAVYHILLQPTPIPYAAIVFAGGFFLTLLPYLIIHFPTDKRVAKALDETGLQERAGTMLAFRKEDGTLIRMQREDALTHISQAVPGGLSPKPARKKLPVALIALAVAVTALLLPHDLLAPRSNLSPEEAAQVQAVNDLIAQLRQEVEDALLEEALKAELQAIIDQLEQDLLNSTSELDRAALLAQAQQDMSNVVIETLSHYQIGRALQQYSMTENLGTFIREMDVAQIPRAMDDLQQKVEEASRQNTRLRSNISAALTDSGVAETDALYVAFQNFVTSLDGYQPEELVFDELLDGYVMVGTPGDISFIFDAAEEEILAALDEQAHTMAEMDDAQRLLEEGFTPSLPGAGDELIVSPQDEEESQGGGGGGGNGSSQQMTPGQGSSNVGGLVDGPDSAERTSMLEGIYDPVSGSVTYGEVFAAYYAEYLAALESGEIPDELRELFDRYFSALS